MFYTRGVLKRITVVLTNYWRIRRRYNVRGLKYVTWLLTRTGGWYHGRRGYRTFQLGPGTSNPRRTRTDLFWTLVPFLDSSPILPCSGSSRPFHLSSVYQFFLTYTTLDSTAPSPMTLFNHGTPLVGSGHRTLTRDPVTLIKVSYLLRWVTIFVYL